MIKTLASSALALAMVSTPALAQSVAPDWSGPYIGIFGGYNQSNDDGDENLGFDRNLDGRYGDQVTTTPVAPATVGINAFTPGFCGGTATSTVPTTGCRDDNDGVEAGVRAGYDMQFGNFVVGALAEYSVNNVQDSVTGFSTTPAFYTFTRELESTAAARLKLGYAAGPALIYGTGGYAYGKFENKFRTSNQANSFTETSEGDDGDGWQAGGGVEYALGRGLTVNGEYLYTSLDVDSPVIRVGNTGTTPAANPFISAPNTTGTDMIRSNGKFGTHMFRIGMNYRF
ncbi:MAG: outer membrane beta-barrel protein [Brevundimonas sp.]|jgi:outer membrane immunogenic protein|uniref:outer membrane protein n=1 Tax=Brevundimonas sp. Leaf280 TaxID=1736320 RepID=UPI0006FD8067|nr:outer membrane beta-barrel protein [Brevundimonas sp. Leaf280]KQP45842.1 porin [Brevundimonas sp. Leaf280]